MKDKIVLTKGKVEELKKELRNLEKRKVEDLGKTLEQARLSDVSEDTDAVVAVMGDIQKVDMRINEINEILENAEILEKTRCNVNKIEVGSRVKLKVGGKSVEYNIVSAVESDPLKYNISDKSPLGKALLKAKKGDTVKLSVDGRKMEYEVLEIC